MATYRGFSERTPQRGMLVKKDNDILSPVPSQKLYNHSPDGFNWGYGGSGPAQLALALLLDVTGDRNIALAHYQQFKWAIVAKLGVEWVITTEEILAWLDKQKYLEAKR